MSEAMDMLTTIKEGYFTFSAAMVEQAGTFPATVDMQLDVYAASLCELLGVEKKQVKFRVRSPCLPL